MTNKCKLKYFSTKILLVIIAFSSLMACEKLGDETGSSQYKHERNKHERNKKYHQNKKSSQKHHYLWERIRKNLSFATKSKQTQNNPRVQQYVKQYRNNDKQIQNISKASPYLHYIVEELEKRDMPVELALLPMIESSFEPGATSRKGAAGLWQFMGRTGRQFGLKQDKWYDGRRDITASTQAALDYLQFLHEQFDNNWMLALAAYNAGPGTVTKAIQKNLRAGKPTNFWSLSLPKETQNYVPKFLALAELIAHPEKHDISLPLIENKPYFVPVNPGKYLTFNKVSQLADINMKELKKLNPGYRRQSTHPKGPKQILLPTENAIKLKENLSNP